MSDCRLEEGVAAVRTALDGVDMFGASCLRFRVFVAVEVVEVDECLTTLAASLSFSF